MKFFRDNKLFRADIIMFIKKNMQQNTFVFIYPYEAISC